MGEPQRKRQRLEMLPAQVLASGGPLPAHLVAAHVAPHVGILDHAAAVVGAALDRWAVQQVAEFKDMVRAAEQRGDTVLHSEVDKFGSWSKPQVTAALKKALPIMPDWTFHVVPHRGWGGVAFLVALNAKRAKAEFYEKIMAKAELGVRSATHTWEYNIQPASAAFVFYTGDPLLGRDVGTLMQDELISLIEAENPLKCSRKRIPVSQTGIAVTLDVPSAMSRPLVVRCLSLC
eukprot:TRINITY_DN20135_c0_g1_i1.p1 TRINITY_DN20135_c0_g1~~TRINITY_DN20135_c0_g1_i1.p1  ORF type:complete len:263 (+),score=74.86 TRINITY_DN20135_c0_g1_i1:91-789(+)